jgi:hypothetical protein
MEGAEELVTYLLDYQWTPEEYQAADPELETETAPQWDAPAFLATSY